MASRQSSKRPWYVTIILHNGVYPDDGVRTTATHRMDANVDSE